MGVSADAGKRNNGRNVQKIMQKKKSQKIQEKLQRKGKKTKLCKRWSNGK